MDPMSMVKIRAMSKCSNCRRQQQMQMLLPTMAACMVATSVLCLLVTSPVWAPRLCSLMAFFFLTTLPDLAMAFLLSPKCLFVVGNLIVAFLVGESRLSPKAEPASLVNDIHEEHVKRNAATGAKAVAAIDHNAMVGELGQGEEEEEEEEEEEDDDDEEEEELHQRVEDFIARVRRQRRMEDKSFFDTDR
ncbi:uncharacterized protein LOC102709973 [Oryza brachyantha]|uniref:DUF4408 domain-containing protein n=1 Tax=Oryza brachyantha TaxID=4533 RepID=J3L7B5_ORYBR|nr:uncharacterized protein LOC102709973 [Oryza brachyantha]